MRLLATIGFIMLLSACSLLETTPQPAPPLTDAPQEIQRSQTFGLTKIGAATAHVRGAPTDVEAAIKAKAAAAHADYYQIVMIDDGTIPGQWYSYAILYRK